MAAGRGRGAVSPRTLLVRGTVGVVLLCGAAAAWVARDRDLPTPGPEELTELHARWDGMTEPDRERFRARFGELESLPAVAREELGETVRRLDELARLVFRAMDPKTQERMLGLEPAKRRELLREMAVEEARAFSQRVLERLPDEDRARLERASEADRLRFFVDFRRRQDKKLDESMDRMAQEIGMGAEELARQAALPPDQRRARFLDLVQRSIVRAVDQRGLPEGIPQARWEHLCALAPREFYLAVLRLQEDPSTRLPVGRRPAERGWSRVRTALREDVAPEARLELAHLTGQERRTRLRSLRRDRVSLVLVEEDLLDAETLADLGHLPDAAFLADVRERARGER